MSDVVSSPVVPVASTVPPMVGSPAGSGDSPASSPVGDAKSSPEASETKPTVAVEGADASPEGEKQKATVDIPAGRLAALDRKAAQVRAEKAALASQKAEVEAQLATLKDRQAFQADFKSNPRAAMESMGMTPDQIDAAILDWYQTQKPKTPDEEIKARDAELEKYRKAEEARKADEQRAAAEKAASEQRAATYAVGKSVIETCPADVGDIVTALQKAGEVVTSALYPDGVSVEKLVVDAAAAEWRDAGSPKISEAQFRKLLTEKVKELNSELAKNADVVAKFRKTTTTVVESTPKSPAEIGRGERFANLKKPTSRAEVNAYLKKLNSIA